MILKFVTNFKSLRYIFKPNPMFSLQLKLALRYLYRNRSFTFINLIGLSLGLAAFIYVLILVSHETQFDNFYPDNKRIYRVTSTLVNGDKRMSSGFCNAPVGPTVAAEIPGIESFCRVSAENQQKLIVGSDMITIGRFRYAEMNFFNFFGFKLIQGSSDRVLNQPGSIVLSRSEAIRIFASKNPLGQVVKTPEGMEFVVTGVAEDPPSNTHLIFDAVASYLTLENRRGIYLEWDGGWTFLTYLRLSPAIDPDNLTEKFPAFLEDKINKKFRSAGWEMSLGLQPIRDVHLNSHLDYDCPTNRSKASLLIISTIAFLILILAIINYINLSTAIAFTRVRETGMRKIMGAAGSQIWTQLLAESVVLTLLAGAISIFLLLSFCPMLNQFTRSDFALKDSPVLVAVITLLATLFTGFISGVGPAWLLSRQKAMAGIQNTIMGRRRNYFRNGLVSFQFFAAVVLIVTLMLMQKQNSFVNSMDLGFERHSIGSLNVSKGFELKDAGRVIDELKKIPEIVDVSISSEMPGAGVTSNGYGLEGKENIELIKTIYTDENFLNCYGIKLIKGRDFRGTTGSDASGFLVNQALVDFAGWTDPIGKKITRNQAFEVIGVVDDFHFSSLYEPVAPLIISVNPASDSWSYYFVNMRFNTTDVASLLNKIKAVWERTMPEQLFEFQFLDNYLATSYQSLGQNQKMITLFSLLAVLIAAIGLFGLSAFITVSRRKEIGIRKVNGATTAQIMALLNYRMVRWVLIGFVIACPVASYLMNLWLQSFAFKTTISWWIFMVSGALVVLVAVVTVSWESFKSARRNPVETLRYE
ncbi:MAG: FtsX-like permease family protein [Porphyromonadaceae bacterium]|nr:MAG: FtsX-like permease family protein [Porphyromonadaceae bacterium]